MVTRSWLGVPWLGCSLTDGRPPCQHARPGGMSLCAFEMSPYLRGTGQGFPGHVRQAEPTDFACDFLWAPHWDAEHVPL